MRPQLLPPELAYPSIHGVQRLLGQSDAEVVVIAIERETEVGLLLQEHLAALTSELWELLQLEVKQRCGMRPGTNSKECVPYALMHAAALLSSENPGLKPGRPLP
jgi:hypothetical protein